MAQIRLKNVQNKTCFLEYKKDFYCSSKSLYHIDDYKIYIATKL